MRQDKWRAASQMVAVLHMVLSILGLLTVMALYSCYGTDSVIKYLKDSFGITFGDWSPKQQEFVTVVSWVAFVVPFPYLLLMLMGAVFLLLGAKPTNLDADPNKSRLYCIIWRNINIGLLIWWLVHLICQAEYVPAALGALAEIFMIVVVLFYMASIPEDFELEMEAQMHMPPDTFKPSTPKTKVLE